MGSIEYPRIVTVGEAAFTVEFGERLDEALNARVHGLAELLAARPVPGQVELVPTYRALLVRYDPLVAGWEAVRTALGRALEGLATSRPPEGRLVEVPVHYGGAWGPDLEDVAAHCGLSAAEVIERHSAALYRVAMLGFAPGFAYLFGLPEGLATPRLATPRMRVEPGSVGIAGPQAGLYALPTPGGWRIIGRTLLRLFDPERAEPFGLQAGDRVRFMPLGARGG